MSSSATNVGCDFPRTQPGPSTRSLGQQTKLQSFSQGSLVRSIWLCITREPLGFPGERGIEPIEYWHKKLYMCACKPIHIHLCDTQITVSILMMFHQYTPCLLYTHQPCLENSTGLGVFVGNPHCLGRLWSLQVLELTVQHVALGHSSQHWQYQVTAK